MKRLQVKIHLRLILIGCLFLIPFVRPSRAAAQIDPWEFEVYPYATEPRGMLELETDNAIVNNGHSHGYDGTAAGGLRSQGMWYNSYELTYGLTDRIEAAAYLNLAQVSGDDFWYAGSKYRLRGRLFNEDTLPIELGWYLELEWHKAPQYDNDTLELEMRPILEKDIGRFSFLANPTFEKVLVGPDQNEGFQFGYSTGIYYRWIRYLSPGVEFYGAVGNIDDNTQFRQQQHYVFPVIWGELPHGIEYNIGPGFGLTAGSDHVLLKFNLGLERFVGAIFGQSSDSNWFF
jgi:hypothetical protein